MTYEYEPEPQPVKLTGPIAKAWERILENEWFDGEPSLQYGAQQRLIREWNENGPSRMSTYTYETGTIVHRYFATRREAEAEADKVNVDYDGEVTVVASKWLPDRERAFDPYR